MRSAAPLMPAAVPAQRSDAAPALRPGTVPRARIVRRLAGSGAVPVVALVAPAGSGKTTVLAEWAMRDERSFRWIAPDDDADAALRLVTTAAARRIPQVIVLDDAHLVADETVAELMAAATRLPVGAVFAVASRRRLPVASGRLRAHRLLVDVAPHELAMSRLEAAMLLDAAGLRLDGEQVDLLVTRTEGWPVALYLAALSLSEQDDVDAATNAFSGADRLVADYLDCELLAELPGEQRTFLRRSSLLGRLTGALCDAVLQTRGSADTLSELRASGLPVAALDRADLAFRYHPLLAAALRAELTRTERDLEPALHARAADWHDRHGEGADAVRHAVAAGDAARAGRLLWSLAPGYASEGRTPILGSWLTAFRDGERAAHPALALSAAAYHLAEGRIDDAERAAEAAQRALADAPEGDALEAAVPLLLACTGRRGAAQIGEDAAAADRLLAPASVARGVASLLIGVAHHLTGDREAAAERLAEGASRSAGSLPLVNALCHTQLALLAVDESDWDAAERHAHAAYSTLEPVLAPHAVRALVLAVYAVVAGHRGDLAQARHDAADARRLLADLSGFPAWLVAEAHVWLARAEIRLSDGTSARALLARAARIQARVPDAVVLAQWVHDGWERADAFAASATGDGPALTNAELRVLRLLPSHLSFREIGSRLHVSTNTVKTHALSVYRKLDVSSRSEAVERGCAAGLIDR
jgi:LuxR family transcriptional regulator, maltose regulon positive regulatory protein